MNKFAGKTVIIAALFYSSVSFCSALDDESSALRIKCISNIDAIFLEAFLTPQEVGD